MNEQCRPVLQRLGAPFGPETRVGMLSIAEQQLVEIARALHAKSKILVLDEPTTALSSRESERLFTLVRQLRSEGIALIYISHRMAEVYDLSDRVSVLRDGTYVGTLEREEISAEALVKMMVGRDLSTFYKKEHDPHFSRGPVILEVRDITDGGRRVKPCSFQVHQGEVLGIAGLVGSGRTELARLIFGADARTGGEVILDGRPVSITEPQDALNLGIAYLTEDRKALGLFLDMSCGENINLGVLHRDAHRGGILNLAAARRRAENAFKALRVRAASPIVTVGSLSGGNQQKVLGWRLALKSSSSMSLLAGSISAQNLRFTGSLMSSPRAASASWLFQVNCLRSSAYVTGSSSCARGRFREKLAGKAGGRSRRRIS
jgi:ribose transport system ATP-binding protein